MSTNTNTTNSIDTMTAITPAAPLSATDNTISGTVSTTENLVQVEKTGTTCCGFCDSKNSTQ